MSSITIRIADDLKVRIAAAAKRAGKTPHAFILDVLTETVETSELDDEFHRIADERWADFLRTGESVPWDEAKAWLEARARGKTPPWPRARKLGI